MSLPLPVVDLSTAVVGQTGTVDWQQQTQQSASPTGYSAAQVRGAVGQAPKLQIFNESGCGLQLHFSTGEQPFIPAGGWLQVELQPSCTSYDWTVLYAIPNPPVSSLINIYHYAYETPPNTPILGNSPVGIGGPVSTTTTQAIKNDGNAPATSIIEATPSDQVSSAWSLANDASGFIQVLSANTLKKILNVVRGNATTGKAVVTLGDSGDATILTIYGSLLGGQNATVGTITATAINTSALNTTQIAAGSASPSDMLNMVRTGAFGTGQFVIGIDTNGRLYIFDGGRSAFAAQNISSETTSNAGGRLITARSNGGGAAGWINWQGTTDPGTNAAEGDTWDKG